MADQAHPLAGAITQREVVVERRAMAAVAERHMVERGSRRGPIRIGVAPGAVGDAERLGVQRDESSMSLTERCRLRMCMPTSRR